MWMWMCMGSEAHGMNGIGHDTGEYGTGDEQNIADDALGCTDRESFNSDGAVWRHT